MWCSIDSGDAALPRNQLSADVTSGGAPLTQGGVELGGGGLVEFTDLGAFGAPLEPNQIPPWPKTSPEWESRGVWRRSGKGNKC